MLIYNMCIDTVERIPVMDHVHGNLLSALLLPSNITWVAFQLLFIITLVSISKQFSIHAQILKITFVLIAGHDCIWLFLKNGLENSKKPVYCCPVSYIKTTTLHGANVFSDVMVYIVNLTLDS